MWTESNFTSWPSNTNGEEAPTHEKQIPGLVNFHWKVRNTKASTYYLQLWGKQLFLSWQLSFPHQGKTSNPPGSINIWLQKTSEENPRTKYIITKYIFVIYFYALPNWSNNRASCSPSKISPSVHPCWVRLVSLANFQWKLNKLASCWRAEISGEEVIIVRMSESY